MVSLVLVAAACVNTDNTTAKSVTATLERGATIQNQGGDLEGHTPTGFAGTGVGLIVGDNLNPSFPQGQGVQTYLTFSLPEDLSIEHARLTSDLLQTSGTPFDDLGDLLAEPVEYEVFGPELFDLPTSGEPVGCRVIGTTSLECDVTAAVQDAVGQGRDVVQFRLRFERAADNDGEADLAMFYRTDSNTNEQGLFSLVMTAAS